MNNKEIIIDGVDVSGCIVFNNKWGTPLCNPTEDIREAVHCSDYPSCLYKQLKRKEQECEELKEQLESTKGLVTVGNKQLAEALKGYEELTSKCSQLEEKLEKAKRLAMLRRECLEAIKELTGNANLPNIGLYIDSFLNEEPQNKRGGR